MTEKEKKQKLLSYKINMTKLENIKEEYLMLENKLIYPKISKITDMPKASNTIMDKEAEGITSLIEIEKKMIKKQFQILDEIEAVNKSIDELKNEQYVKILTLRYKKNMRWEEIAYEMHRTLDTCYKIHGRALQNINF